jgi:hypothetical protein
MCAAGSAFAVMGNHEFNALGWAEADGNGIFYGPIPIRTPNRPKNFCVKLAKARATIARFLTGSKPCQYG